MPTPVPVTIPLLNPNEPEARLISLAVSAGDRVSAGDTLCTLETTKSAAEVAAEADGYVVGLRLKVGDLARAGEVLCYLADTPRAEAPEAHAEGESAGAVSAPGELPPGLRITQPARALAEELGIDLRELPCGPLLTEIAVRKFYSERSASPEPEAATMPATFDPGALVVYGGGGHGKSLIDLVRALGQLPPGRSCGRRSRRRGDDHGPARARRRRGAGRAG